MHALIEARRAAPAVLYLPHLQLWWQTAHASLRATLWMLLSDLPPDLPLLLLAVADCPLEVLSKCWTSTAMRSNQGRNGAGSFVSAKAVVPHSTLHVEHTLIQALPLSDAETFKL